MTVTETQVQLPTPTRTGGGTQPGRLLAVVGFDGSVRASAALDAAASMIKGRPGHLEVVFVAHMPGGAAMTAPTYLGVRRELAVFARQLNEQAHLILDDREPRWHFQRRDGSIVRELATAAADLRAQAAENSTIAIVVGTSRVIATRTGWSVSARLARRMPFALLVVPETGGSPTMDGRGRR